MAMNRWNDAATSSSYLRLDGCLTQLSTLLATYTSSLFSVSILYIANILWSILMVVIMVWKNDCFDLVSEMFSNQRSK